MWQSIIFHVNIKQWRVLHTSLQWRHNGCDGVSNHQSHDCSLNRWFRRRSRKHQSSMSLAFVRGIHRWPVNSPHKWPVTPPMFTVVKRTRVPAGSLVKMATDADVDSGRKRTLIQSVEAYTWNVLSGKIHEGIKNIQCKSRLRWTFHRCTIAPRKNIFWRGCFVFMFCRCRWYLYFFTRVPGIFTRVPALYKGAWFVSNFHYRVFHRTLVAQTRQQTCER